MGMDRKELMSRIHLPEDIFLMFQKQFVKRMTMSGGKFYIYPGIDTSGPMK